MDCELGTKLDYLTSVAEDIRDILEAHFGPADPEDPDGEEEPEEIPQAKVVAIGKKT